MALSTVSSPAVPISGMAYLDQTWSGATTSPRPMRRTALSIVEERENAVQAPTAPWLLIGPSVPSTR